MNELTTQEKKDLRRLERVIDKGLGTFIEVGVALREVRDGELFRATHKTFEKYIETRFEISRQHAYRLIDAVEVRESLSPIGDKLPTRESQYRELNLLPDDVAPVVWDTVVAESEAEGTEPTAKAIKDVAKRVVEPEIEPQEATVDPVIERAVRISLDCCSKLRGHLTNLIGYEAALDAVELIEDFVEGFES